MSAELPKGWGRVALGQCCEIISGATPSRDVPEYWDGDIPWVTPKDISKLDQPVLDDAPEKITQAGYAACSTSLIPAGSILFSSRAPIGLVAIAGRKMCTNQGFKSLVPGKEVDSGFLYWTMKRNAPRVAALGNGATFKEVSKEIVARFQIDLPPLDEQLRIAAILDKADAIRRKRQQALAVADDFLRSVFLEMFGDPVKNTKRWPVAPLGDVLNGIDSGFSPKCQDRTANEGEWGVLKLSAVTSTVFSPAQNKAIIKFDDVDHRHEVRPGDLLFTRKNTYELVGASALVGDCRERLLMPDLIFRLVTNKKVDRKFLWAQLTQPTMRKMIQGLANGAAGSMPNISKSRLIELPILLPDMADQAKFASVYERTVSLKSFAEQGLLTADTLFASLSQQAFHGELG